MSVIGPFEGDYEFLSNFYPCAVVYEDMVFPSVEHAYQAAKTQNLALRVAFTKTLLTPAKAKKAGRKLVLRPDWEDMKISIMEECLRSKFANQGLAQKLKATGNNDLVEINWWGDVFWGVHNGYGQNWLGKLLMKIRPGIIC